MTNKDFNLASVHTEDFDRRSQSTGRSTMRRHCVIPSLLLLLMTAGCLYEIRDEIIDFEFQIKNCMSARSAWAQCSDVYRSMEHYKDFRKGFLAGYDAVAFGANECPPSLPPCCYWKSCYATDVGKAKANAWFDGYSHGALAAQGDGIADNNRIVTRSGRQDDHQLGSGVQSVDSEFSVGPQEMDSAGPFSELPLPPPAPVPATDSGY